MADEQDIIRLDDRPVGPSYQSFVIGEANTVVNVIKSSREGVLLGLDYVGSRSTSSDDILIGEVEFVSEYAPTKDAIFIRFLDLASIQAFQSYIDSAKEILQANLIQQLSNEVSEDIDHSDISQPEEIEKGMEL